MSTTVNMNLTLPTVSTTPGTDYASQNNTAFEAIDEHDHTSGKGVAVPVAGLNINADLPMNSNNLTEVRTVRLETQASEPTEGTDLQIIYSRGGDLYWRDANGDEVQITNGSDIASSAGNITGMGDTTALAFYNDANKAFTFNKAADKPAKLNISEISIYEFDNDTANPITLKTPTSVATAYDITLPPTVAGAVELLNMDASGVMNHATLSGTTNQVNISQSATAITLSTPQDIHTGASPTFAGMGLTGGLDMNSNGMTDVGIIKGGIGSSVTAPAYTFNGDDNTGIYRQAANSIGFSGGGVLQAHINTSGLNMANNINMNSNDITNGAAITGTDITGTSVSTGNGAIKWKLFSGDISGTSNVDLDIAGATVYGATGFNKLDSDTDWDVMGTGYGGSNQVYFLGTHGDQVRIRQGGSALMNYRVIVWYI